MKKIVLFAIILISSLQSFAGWKNAMLRLKHDMGRSISVTIDGRRYNKIGRNLTVGDLPPGMHRIKIYKYNSNGYGYSNGVLIYQGNINLRPGRIYYGIVSYNGLDLEENCCIDDYGHWNQNDNWDDHDQSDNHVPANTNQHHDGHDQHQGHEGDNHSGNGHGNHSNEPNWNNENDNTWNNNNQWNQQDNGNYNDNSWGAYNGQMSEGRFKQLIDQIKKASFETSKESVAKQALKTNNITCSQLVRILNEFSFESTKLQFAKDAYKNVVDKNNYYLINDVFVFQSSKDDLLEFLEHVGK